MKQLSRRQKQILELTAQLRFVTAPLLTTNYDLKSRQSMVITLNRMVDKGYLGIRKSRNNDFSNRGHSYYMTPDGYRLITNQPNDYIMKQLYRNKTVTRKFINHCNDVMRVCIKLKQSMPKNFKIYTNPTIINTFKDELLRSQIPDLCIHDSKNNRFIFIEILHDEHLFIAKKKLRNHCDTINDWAHSERLDILFILDTKGNETNFLKYAVNKLEERYVDTATIFTTTLSNLTRNEEVKFSAINCDDCETVLENTAIDYIPKEQDI